ncbi:MAG: PASTA domain-containing protein [Frankiales bacterium]|nr:PASTA domain-containing protein [Frankiales bacterium]
MRRTVRLIALAFVISSVTAACGGTASPAVTVTQTTTAAAVTPESSAPAPVSSSPETATSKPAETAAADTITVPNGVGMDYQSAQDLWRAAGLHVAPATDATGANRLPIIDSNWVVLAQDLKPGSKVPADSFITATVKKYTDK